MPTLLDKTKTWAGTYSDFAPIYKGCIGQWVRKLTYQRSQFRTSENGMRVGGRLQGGGQRSFMIWFFGCFGSSCKNAVCGFWTLAHSLHYWSAFTLGLLWGKPSHGLQVCWETRALPQPALQGGLLWASGTETWEVQLFTDRTILIHRQRSSFPVSAGQFQSPPGMGRPGSPWPNMCLSVAYLQQPRAVQLCTHTTEHLPRWHWDLLLLSKALCPADDNPFWVPAPYLLISLFVTISGLLSPYSNTQLQLELTACLVPSVCLWLLWPQL